MMEPRFAVQAGHPERLGLGKLGGENEARGQRVVERNGEGRLAVRRGPGGRDLDAERSRRIEAVSGQAEDAHLLELGRVGGRQLVDPDVVVGGRDEGLRALDHLDPVEDARSAPRHAPMRVQTARRDEERGIPGAQRRQHAVEGLRAEQVPPDGGRVENRRVEIEEIAGLGQRDVGVRQRRAGLRHRRGDVGERALGGEIGPGRGREGDAVDPLPGPADETAPDGQRARRAQDRVADDAGGDRRARDHVGQVGARAERGHLFAGQIETGERADIGGDVRVGDAERQNGLVVAHQFGAGDAGVGRHGDEDVDRPAGIPGRGRDLPGRGDVAREAVRTGHAPAGTASSSIRSIT